MITPKGRRALAIGLALCNTGCVYGVYGNDTRDPSKKTGDAGQPLAEKAMAAEIKCMNEQKQALIGQREASERTTKCYDKMAGVQDELLMFLSANALLNNPLYRVEDRAAVEKALMTVIGTQMGMAPKTSKTLFEIYDWVTVKIGVDKDDEGMMYPADSLESRFANRHSRLVLLAAMLEGAIPNSTRIIETHSGKTADISLEFNIRLIDGMPKDVAGTEKALALLISERYGVRLPAAMAVMKGALRADKHGLWITLDPGLGREMGLTRDDGTGRNDALNGIGKPG